MITEWVSVCSSLIFMALACSPAGAVKIEPPWEKSPANGVNFTVPGIDNVPDLHGDIVNPDLVIFFGGNEFMVVPDLLSAFKKKYPQYKRIFAETLPPGILPRQVEQGALIIGNLRLEIAPDVWTSGKDRIEELQKNKNLFDDTVTYTKNQLAIMVYRGNPKKISSLKDLGKSDIKVSMPDPDLEDIGKKIIKAYQKTGGQELAEQIMNKKKQDGSTFLTRIHHRQTPIRIMRQESDAGPVWLTEALFQEMIGNPIDTVKIPDEENQEGTSVAARLKNAPHRQAAADFLQFLVSEEGQAVYRKYKFLPVHDHPIERPTRKIAPPKPASE